MSRTFFELVLVAEYFIEICVNCLPSPFDWAGLFITPLCLFVFLKWYTCGVAAARPTLVRLLTALPHVGAPGGQAGQGV
jgi:hypothetical protein